MASKKEKKDKSIKVDVSEEIFKDPRFFKLGVALGSLDTALGCLVRAWFLGQNVWGDTQAGIPIETWDKHQLPHAIIDCGLAEIKEGLVTLKGSVAFFDWLYVKRQDARKGGLATQERRRSEAKLNDDPNRTTLLKQIEPLVPLLVPQPKKTRVYNQNAESETLEQDTHINSKTEEPKDKLPRESKITKEFTEQITQLKAIWLETIQSFNSSVKTLPLQTDIELGRLVQINGYEQTRLALLGARFEERTENFDPSKNLNIRRFFKQNIFEKFVILGQRPLQVDSPPQFDPDIFKPKNSPEEIKKFLSEVGNKFNAVQNNS